MSHLWNKTLELQIDAQQLHATLRPSWRQRRAGAIHISSGRSTPLAQALQALLGELQQQGDLAQAGLQVSVANALVHFDVVAGHYASYSAQQLQAIAQGCVAELLGDAAADQAVRWQLQPDLQHLLLCAMEQSLIDAVVQAAQQHGLHLHSLQPAFCAHWSRYAYALHQGSGVFSVVETDSAGQADSQAGVGGGVGYGLIACAEHGSIMALSHGRWALPVAAPNSIPDNTPNSALDQRVDRLLASLGQPAQELNDFVLLAREPQALAPSARWKVLDWQLEPA